MLRGDIPKAKKVMYVFNCSRKHHGVCRFADRAQLPQIDAFSDALYHRMGQGFQQRSPRSLYDFIGFCRISMGTYRVRIH